MSGSRLRLTPRGREALLWLREGGALVLLVALAWWGVLVLASL